MVGQDGDKDTDADALRGNGMAYGETAAAGERDVGHIWVEGEKHCAVGAGGRGLFFQRRTFQLRDLDVAGEGKCVHQTRENTPV